jgi:hypothetical protein
MLDASFFWLGIFRSAAAAPSVFEGACSGFEKGWLAVGCEEDVAGVAVCAVAGGGVFGAALGVLGAVATVRMREEGRENMCSRVWRLRRQVAQIDMVVEGAAELEAPFLLRGSIPLVLRLFDGADTILSIRSNQ